MLQKENNTGLKYDDGKLRFDLFPLDSYIGTTKVLTYGAIKYAPYSWLNVKPKERYYAAAIRHLTEHLQVMEKNKNIKTLPLDSESGLPSLDHAICSLMFFRELSKKEIDERNKE